MKAKKKYDQFITRILAAKKRAKDKGELLQLNKSEKFPKMN